MAEPRDELEARTPPGGQNGNGAPGEIRQEIAQTRAEMSETIDVIEQELQPQHTRHEVVAAFRQETVERVDRLIGEVTLRASRAGTAAAEVAQQVSREARTRLDSARARVTGGTPTETGERTRREARTAAAKLRQWAREDPVQLAAVLAVVLAAVIVVVRAPRNPTQARIRALQRRARG